MSEYRQGAGRVRGSAKRNAARGAILAAIALLLAAAPATAQSSSQHGVKTLSPPGAIKPTGTWDVAARAGDFVFIAETRGHIAEWIGEDAYYEWFQSMARRPPLQGGGI